MKKQLQHFFFFLTMACGFNAYSQDGANDPTFNPTDVGFGIGDGAKGTVYAMALQSDGKIIIGGSFISYNGTGTNGIARLNANGTIDTAFNLGTGAGHTIKAIALQSDGKILIGGEFSSYNGTPCNDIARLNVNGTLDATFNTGTGTDGDVEAIAIQNDGKIIIGGGFDTFNSVTKNGLTRLNSDGTLDATFNVGTGTDNSFVGTLAIQGNGKVIIGGGFTTYNGDPANHIARLNTDGTLDTAFHQGNGASHPVYTTALQSDGKIIMGGAFTYYDGTAINYIARLNADGTLDGTYNIGSGANVTVTAITKQADGKIIIAGPFTTFNGITKNHITRLNTNGTIDGTFTGTGANGNVYATLLQSNGKIIIGGDFSSCNGKIRNSVARLNADGTTDATFNVESGLNSLDDNYTATITIQNDGKIIVGSNFFSCNATPKNNIVRLNTNGSIDNTFNIGTGTTGYIYTSTIQNDGKIIIGGNFYTYNGTTINRIARLNTDGSLDGTFNIGTGITGLVYTTALQKDGKIIITGSFNSFDGTAKNNILRLNANGSLDQTFNSGTGADNAIFSSVIQSDGKILIGGFFNNYNGASRNCIARLNADGTVDSTFTIGSGANYIIHTIALQNDDKIIISGEFTSYNGTSRNRIARLNKDGSLDGTFNTGTGADTTIWSTIIQNDGKIIIGGSFSSYNGKASKHIARLNADGSLDQTFNVGTGANKKIAAMAKQKDGNIIITGKLTSYNNIGRNRIARIISSNVTAISENNPEQSFIIYPNPFAFQTTIAFNKDLKNATFKIIDVLGKVMKNGIFSGNELIVKKEALKAGIYFIEVVEENKMVLNEKVVVQ